jgi:hypothetical protein
MTNTALIVPAQTPASTNLASAPAFHDAPKPLIYIPNGWAWFIGILLALALLAALFFLWRWWHKRRAILAVPAPIPPHVRARRKLEQALAMISEPKPFSTLVSHAIREYLEARFDFRAPERTTEEFLYELQGTALLTPAQKKSLGDFLESCDLIKFAKYEPSEAELRGLHAAALRLVNETEPRIVPAGVPPPAPAGPPPPPVRPPPPPVRPPPVPQSQSTLE